jgi:alpha-tubulin suppressor-like RCC1 family protein
VDSQSVKTTRVGGEQRGFDGGKKVRGRKRHILVDTEGLLIEWQPQLAGVTEIATNWYDHSMALKGDGTVLAWGENYDGQLDECCVD